MKRVTAAVVAAAAFVASGNAEAAPRYEGALVIFAKAGTCADYDPVGEEMIVRFRPAGVGDNAAVTGFTYLWGNGGYNLVVPGSITPTFKTGTLTQIFDYGSSTSSAKIKFSSQVPQIITANTPTVYAVGSLTDFDFMIGCTVTFRMSAVKRLN